MLILDFDTSPISVTKFDICRCPSAPPEFLIPVSDVACESGDSVTLRCKVCGRPRATITWRGPDNNTLSNDGHYSITFR